MSCVILIGMPGAGKSTIGKELASILDFVFMDSDYLLEACYGRRLQDITDKLSRDEFLNAEAQMICAIQAHNAVIATGGSVIYRAQAMAHLQTLGTIVHLDLPLADVQTRIAINPERGISFGPGQDIKQLYEERTPLYRKYADLVCATNEKSAMDCASWIAASLPIASKK